MPSGCPMTWSHMPWASEAWVPFAMERNGRGCTHAGLRRPPMRRSVLLHTHRWTALRFPLAGEWLQLSEPCPFLWVCAPFNSQVSCCA